jgi:hypothetical protein
MATFILWPGPIRISVKASMEKFIDSLSDAETWEVTVKKYKRDRSDAQNSALWGLAYKIMAEETGNDPDDLHVYFCGEFFGWREVDVLGKKKVKPRRTTTRDENGKRDVIKTSEFSDFFNTIQRRAAEIGIYIPDPERAQ